MCDTVVAVGNATADGATILGKNSDREPNEAHHLLRVPRTRHKTGSTVNCTYIEIPQVEETNAMLLAKPFWMWGAEMGANEHGVAIGNEAVFTKVPYTKEGGLTGMDLLRLGLERGNTAREALDVITRLLEKYGQGGNCGFTHDLYYHNSYIIADPTEAWVLETAGQHWAAENVTNGVRTISNGLTIGSEWDLASDHLIDHAIEKGWCKNRDNFHFARCYSDFVYTTFGQSKQRYICTADHLGRHKGAITVQHAISALRSHAPDHPSDGTAWTPTRGLSQRQICQHAGFGPIRGDQTTGSLASYLGKDAQTHFVTGTSAPCTSIFKPVWVDILLPDTGPEPSGTYDDQSLFWQHEVLHRATLHDYAGRMALYEDDRTMLEEVFIEEAVDCQGTSAEMREAFVERCFKRAAQAEARWTKRVQQTGGAPNQGILYGLAWGKFNREAQMPDLH